MNTKIDVRREIMGKWLIEQRQRLCLTQSQVASALGFTTGQFVSNWERGVSLPPVSQAPTLAAIFELRTEAVIDVIFDCREAELADERKQAHRWARITRRRA